MKKNVFEMALYLFPAFLKEYESELNGRKGVYLLGADLQSDGFNMIGGIMGQIPFDKRMQKMAFATEKLQRTVNSEYYTSFATQNESEGKYGGCVRTSDFILSCSGFPPKLDHLFVLEVLRASGHCSVDEYDDIGEEFKKFVS